MISGDAVKTWICLLRAVNVGGTGKLPMAELRRLCEEIGLEQVRTYIASGNVVCRSRHDEAGVKAALEEALAGYVGKPVGVLVRSSKEMAAVLAGNPFAEVPGNRCVTIFLDEAPPPDVLDHIRGRKDERVALGRREIYVHYGDGMADSKLRIPAAANGTARNMNTVARLVGMAQEIAGD